MKKKILMISLLVVMFVCLFAISVSARTDYREEQTYNYYDEDGNLLYSATTIYAYDSKYSGTYRFEVIIRESGDGFAKFDENGTPLTWYVISDDKLDDKIGGDSVEQDGVQNIVVKSVPTLDASIATVNGSGMYTYKEGNTFAKKVVSANFFTTNVKSFANIYKAEASVKPSGHKDEYCKITDGAYLLCLYLPETLTGLPNDFCKCTPLRVLEFENNTIACESINSTAFNYCANLKKLIIPEGIKTIGEKVFRECISLSYIKIANTVTRVSNSAFWRNSSIETFIMGENVTFCGYLNDEGGRFHVEENKVDCIKIKYYYVSPSLNTDGSDFDLYRGKGSAIVGSYKNVIFFFPGTREKATEIAKFTGDSFKVTLDKSLANTMGMTYNEPIPYETYIANKTYYDTQITHHLLVYNVPNSVAFGTKTVTEPTCTSDGYTTYTCTCGDTYSEKIAIDANAHAFDGENDVDCNNGCGLVRGTARIEDAYYATLADAISAANADDTVVLLANVEASEIITINKAITLDGNGKTITSTAGRAINVSGANGVTIQNVTIVAKGERAINIIQGSTNVSIDNVTASAKNYALNVAGSAAGAVVTVNGGTLNGLNVINVGAQNAHITIDGTTINCNDNNANENYSAIALNKDAVKTKVIATNVVVNVQGDSNVANVGSFGGYVSINGSTENVVYPAAYILGGDYYYTYETLEGAIAAAKAGDTIVLLANVEASEIITIDKAITLDGNGYTITSTAGRAINVDGAKDVTIKDVTVVASGERAINVINGSTNVSIDNVTATAANYAVNVAGSAAGAVVTVNGCTLTGLNVVNVAAANVKVTVNGGKLTCNDATDVENYAALALATNATNSVITAKGVEFDIKDDSCEASNGTITGKIVIDGSEEGANLAYIEYSNGTAYIFSSIEAAIAKAQAGETIVLLAPVTITKDTVLDFSGITIESTGDVFIVTNGATLTINGNGTVMANIDGKGTANAVWANGGHVVINGGSYSVGGDSSASDLNHQNDLIYTKNGGTAVINGGTFDGRNGIWALNEKDNNRGTIKVYGGTFIGFNPANNVSEGEGTNFLADGLHATANGDVYTVEAHSFDTVSSIAYANGYGKAGVKVLECACGETKEESVDALFVTLGYSASVAERGGITVGYKINNEAIAKYEEITGNELVYGVFAAASEVIGNDDIFDANGNTVSGVISKEASSMKLEALNLKLVDFNTEELMAAEIAMGMYVNDGAKVSYVQPEAPITGNKYHTVSYSKLPKEEE